MMKNTFCEPGKLQAGSNQGSEPLLQSGKFKSCGMTIRHLVYLYIYSYITNVSKHIFSFEGRITSFKVFTKFLAFLLVWLNLSRNKLCFKFISKC